MSGIKTREDEAAAMNQIRGGVPNRPSMAGINAVSPRVVHKQPKIRFPLSHGEIYQQCLLTPAILLCASDISEPSELGVSVTL